METVKDVLDIAISVTWVAVSISLLVLLVTMTRTALRVQRNIKETLPDPEPRKCQASVGKMGSEPIPCGRRAVKGSEFCATHLRREIIVP